MIRLSKLIYKRPPHVSVLDVYTPEIMINVLGKKRIMELLTIPGMLKSQKVVVKLYKVTLREQTSTDDLSKYKIYRNNCNSIKRNV